MRLPLEGVLVLDLTRVLAGPFCSMILADLGAEVIKVEVPGTGDDSRAFVPFVNGESSYFMSLNRSKMSLTLNLKHSRGREICLGLAARADILLENFRPGTVDRLGLGYDAVRAVNPGIIYASCSGFGQDGPYVSKPAYDIVAQAMGGVMSITGQPGGRPTRVGASIGDLAGGLFTAIGVLAALSERRRSGDGRWIDVAMLDCQVALLENAIARYAATGEVPVPMGNRHPSLAPFNSVAASDGELIVAIGNDQQWVRLCGLVGREDLARDQRFATNPARVANWAVLEPIWNGIFAACTRQEWLDLLEANGVPCGPINTVDRVFHDPQVNHRGMIVSTNHPVAGRVFMSGAPIKMADTPARPAEPAPTLGQHNAEVLGKYLGLDRAAVEELSRQGVI